MKEFNSFKIANKQIGDGAPVFIIAELSCNHLQKFEIAEKTLHAIKEAGADAIKIQTSKPDSITIQSDKKYFKIKSGTLWDGKTLYDLYKETYTPWEWVPQLKKIAEELGLIFFSSPFDHQAVDFLASYDMPAYKIASFEITDIPLIEHVASKMKPVIISTGIAKIEDIEEAIQACYRTGNREVALLKCTSAYPAPYDEVNLKNIPYLKDKFKCIVGLSDHTLGHTVALASVVLGAKIIEKHFILDRHLGGPDASFSMEPNEFKQMVEEIRIIERALGKTEYQYTAKMGSGRYFARSLFVVKDIQAGEIFTTENIRSIRPGDGLPPKLLNQILGKKSISNLEKGTPLGWDVIS
jgi:pseudaminic acid synthase